MTYFSFKTLKADLISERYLAAGFRAGFFCCIWLTGLGSAAASRKVAS